MLGQRQVSLPRYHQTSISHSPRTKVRIPLRVSGIPPRPRYQFRAVELYWKVLGLLIIPITLYSTEYTDLTSHEVYIDATNGAFELFDCADRAVVYEPIMQGDAAAGLGFVDFNLNALNIIRFRPCFCRR